MQADATLHVHVFQRVLNTAVTGSAGYCDVPFGKELFEVHFLVDARVVGAQ
ncbi:hypothetical protein D3C76_1602820 [compost metagenome]